MTHKQPLPTAPTSPNRQTEIAHQGEGSIVNPTVPEMHRSYYYRPGFGGLKCAGFGAESPEHLAFFLPHFGAGTVILRGYHGDMISAEYAAANQISR